MRLAIVLGVTAEELYGEAALKELRHELDERVRVLVERARQNPEFSAVMEENERLRAELAQLRGMLNSTQHGHGRGPRDENVAEVHEGDPAPHTSAAGLRDTARGLPRRCIQDHLYGGATRGHRRTTAPGGGRR
jgi:hypothetical protein